MTSQRNQLKVVKNFNKTVTLYLERRDSLGRVTRSQFTISERNFNAALMDAQIIAPWNRVTA